MPEINELDDLLNRYAKAERSRTVKIIAAVLVPVVLAATLIIVYAIAQRNAREFSDFKLTQQEKRNEQLEEMIDALLDGPAQAYLRPARLGADLLMAAQAGDSIKVEELVKSIREQKYTMISDGRIGEQLELICGRASSVVASKQPELAAKSIFGDVLVLGKMCGDAWRQDTKGALSEEINHRMTTRIYGDAVKVTSGLSSKLNSSDYERFWKLYWGDMLLVESPEVAQAMVEFGKVLGNDPPNDSSPQAQAMLTEKAGTLKSAVLSDKRVQQELIDF